MVHARRTSIVGNYIEGALKRRRTWVLFFSGKIEDVPFFNGNHRRQGPPVSPTPAQESWPISSPSSPAPLSCSQHDIRRRRRTISPTSRTTAFFTGTRDRCG